MIQQFLLHILSFSLTWTILFSHSSSYSFRDTIKTTTFLRGGGYNGSNNSATAFSCRIKSIESKPNYQLPYNKDDHDDDENDLISKDISSSSSSFLQNQKALILMDQFTPYHGGYISHQARKVYNVTIIHVLSNYMTGYLYQQHQDDQDQEMLSAKIPLHPSRGISSSKDCYYDKDDHIDLHTVADITQEDFIQTQKWKDKINFLNIIGIICESDSGLEDAERFGITLGLYPYRHDGYNRARRDKYLMNQCIAKNGLRCVKQKLCFTEDEAVDFAKELGVKEEEDDLVVKEEEDLGDVDKSTSSILNTKDEDDGLLGLQSKQAYPGRQFCVVKPRRGVASDDVHLCQNISSVRQAFRKIFGSVVFGSTSDDDERNRHDSVLVQEFAVGTEYAVDFVSKNGCHKMAALWKYDKRPANDAPFVYHATELINATASTRAKEIDEYVKNVLDSLEIRWGMTHNEVIVDDIGPRLVEVNCRQHNTDFVPLTTISIGYNALDMLLQAYLGGEEDSKDETGIMTWDKIPELPSTKVYCAIVHLISYVEGFIEYIRQDLIEQINDLPSVVAFELYPQFSIGASIKKTIDITTDVGWAHLVNNDKDQFREDYETILSLMPKLFLVN